MRNRKSFYITLLVGILLGYTLPGLAKSYSELADSYRLLADINEIKDQVKAGSGFRFSSTMYTDVEIALNDTTRPIVLEFLDDLEKLGEKDIAAKKSKNE